MNSALREQFLEPTMEYRGKPFWSWNGRLDREELIRQIHVMKEMGFGGFFMHSRTGLVTEYLGTEWFELINACADEAEKLGMEAWLYDEDRWPSGTAGGMVTQEPKYRLKFMYLEIIEPAAFFWSKNVFAAFSCRMEGLAVYDCIQLKQDAPVHVSSDYRILVFSIVEMERESFYNGFTYVDTLNREATDTFLQLTHERYKQFCGDKFGKSIKGIFTDEPHRGSVFDGFGINNHNKEWRAPWTYTLFDDFRQKFGYDLVSRLPELFLQLNGNPVSQVKWHYIELLQQLFLDNFAKPMNDWCNDNQLILTGHILHEDNLAAQVAMSGSVMRYYEHMEYPGIDVLSEGNMNFWIAKQLSSAARQLGKKWLLSELYGCTGWQMPFEAHKSVGDWQALFGINLRCHHLSWVTMEGESKRDYPASILHQSAWWQDYNYVETYFSRLGLLLQQGNPSCDVLVLNPVESVWCQVYPGWSHMLGAQSPAVQKLEQQYSALFHWLSGAQIDFDYGDEEMLGRMYQIDVNDQNQPILRVGHAAYRVVIVGGLTTIRSTSLAVLQQFIDAGGKVVFAGDAPTYVDALASVEAATIASKATTVPFEQSDIVKVCEALVSNRVIAAERATGEVIKDIFAQVRLDGNRKIVVLLNVNRDKSFHNVRVTLPLGEYIEEWNCATGEQLRIPYKSSADSIEIEADFPPSGERVYMISNQPSAHLPVKNTHNDRQLLVLQGPFDYKLSESNVCVLDFASYRMGEGPWHNELEILKVDRAVREHTGLAYRGGAMIQPWFAQKNEFESKGMLSLRFDFYVEVMPEGLLELAMEQPELFTITINGHKLTLSKSGDWWVDKCFRTIPIPEGILVKGHNNVQLDIEFHQGINLESLYLIGTFGVELDGSKKTLVSLPDQLEVGDTALQKLPFYSGVITYLTEIDQNVTGDNQIVISIPSFEAACVKVGNVEEVTRIIAWQPYEADITEIISSGARLRIDTVLTRRNTFGPLHLFPKKSVNYGPDHWISEGDSFTTEYQLYQAGLLEAPRLFARSVERG